MITSTASEPISGPVHRDELTDLMAYIMPMIQHLGSPMQEIDPAKRAPQMTLQPEPGHKPDPSVMVDPLVAGGVQ